MFWFASPEFKQLWLVAGNRYIQLSYGLEDVAELDEVGGLTVEG